MDIRRVIDGKKAYLELLLLADEQASMIDRYLERGELFVLRGDRQGVDDVQAVCVITQEGPGIYELKNIAVQPEFQRQGLGRRLIDFLFSYYSDLETLLVGTGESPATLEFYRHCGFIESHRIANFFVDHYDHPIIVEGGRQLVDMVYLKRVRTPLN